MVEINFRNGGKINSAWAYSILVFDFFQEFFYKFADIT